MVTNIPMACTSARAALRGPLGGFQHRLYFGACFGNEVKGCFGHRLRILLRALKDAPRKLGYALDDQVHLFRHGLDLTYSHLHGDDARLGPIQEFLEEPRLRPTGVLRAGGPGRSGIHRLAHLPEMAFQLVRCARIVMGSR